MKILVLSDIETHGGAAMAATRLVEGLRARGEQVLRAVGLVTHGDPPPWRRETLAIPRPVRLAGRVVALAGREAERAWRTEAWAQRMRALLKRARPDVISLHNTHFAGWEPELLSTLSSFAPVAWTLHDTWSFTGRCVTPGTCTAFESGCDAACPSAGDYPVLPLDEIRGAWTRKRDVLAANPRVVAVTPSRWMADTARRGHWRDHRVEVIPNGLDAGAFTPVDRIVAREALGIPVDGNPVLLMVAQSLDNRMKGGALLGEALRAVERPMTLLCMGRGRVTGVPPHVRVVELGYTDHDRMKALAYAAADVFVHPSLGDNQPNVVVEAFACGTPVVALPVGGLPELVRPGVTGWLADEATADGMARALSSALDDIEAGEPLSSGTRAVVLGEYTQDVMAGRYLRLFRELAG